MSCMIHHNRYGLEYTELIVCNNSTKNKPCTIRMPVGYELVSKTPVKWVNDRSRLFLVSNGCNSFGVGEGQEQHYKTFLTESPAGNTEAIGLKRFEVRKVQNV